MMKNRIFQAGFALILVLFLSCSIMNIIDIANDPSPLTIQPWDYEVNIPVFYKSYNMTEFYDTFPEFSGSYSQDIPMPVWPSNTNVDFGSSAAISIGAINIDFDSNGSTDASVEKLRSTNATVSLKFTLYDSTKTDEHALSTLNLSNPSMTSDGELYTFSNPSISGNSIIFTTQYLKSTTDYCVSPAGFSAGPVTLDIKDQPASYLANDIMTVVATFDFGDSAEAVVSIGSDVALLDTSIPLNDIPFVDTFTLDLEFVNSLANKFDIKIDNVSYPISTGNIEYSVLGDHYFASTAVKTNSSISMTKDGTNPKIEMIIKASEDFLSTGNDFVRLPRNGLISAKLIVNGKSD